MSAVKLTKHIPKHVSEPGLIDFVVCSCGWKSAPYFDGADYAAMEHRKHVTEAGRTALAQGQDNG